MLFCLSIKQYYQLTILVFGCINRFATPRTCVLPPQLCIKMFFYIKRRFLPAYLILSLLVNTLTPFAFVYPRVAIADEPTVTLTPTNVPEVLSPTPESTIETDETENQISPTSSTSITPAATLSPSPDVSSISLDENKSSEESREPTIKISPTEPVGIDKAVEEGEVSVVIFENVAAPSLDLESVTAETSATLTTDKADYAPTDTAIITGKGLLSSTIYKLYVLSSDEPEVNFSIDITTDESEGFIYAYQLDGIYRPNYSVLVRDSKGNIVAETTFTDSEGAAAIVPFSDSFGTSTVNNVTDWVDSDGGGTGTQIIGASILSRFLSPTLGYAKMNSGGSICRTIDATGFQSLQLGYFWRGDLAIFANGNGIVEYKTGACTSGGAWTPIATHNLNSQLFWGLQQTFSFPSAVDNQTFAIRFRNATSNPFQQFRIDDVSISAEDIPEGTITINKVVSPSNDSGLFNLQIDGITAGTGANVGDGDTTGVVVVSATEHTVSEIAGTDTSLSDYTSTYSCDNNISGEGTTIDPFSIADDEDVVCTFTNTRNTGAITVNKLLDNDGNDSYETVNPASFAWSLDGSGSNAMGSTVLPVYTGHHFVDEEFVPGYHYVGWYEGSTNSTQYSCADPNTLNVTPLPASVDIVTNQTAEITICNQRDKGTITIIKDAINNDGQDFSFSTTGGLGVFILDDDENNSNRRSNTKVFNNVLGGQYIVTEATANGWKLTDLVCDDQNSVTDLDNRQAIINVEDGEDITCTFTNTELGKIRGVKFNDFNGDGSIGFLEPKLNGWTMFIDSNLNSTFDVGEESDVTSGNFIVQLGLYSFGNLLPGTYQICEVEQGGWYSSLPGQSNCQSVAITPGDTDTVNFGNHKALTIRASKVVCDYESDLPNWGNGAPIITSSTAQNFVNSHDGCRLEEGWSFQYGFDGEVSKYSNGDALGAAPAPWKTLGTTNGSGVAEIEISDLDVVKGIWVREELKPGHVPFSYPLAGPTEDDYSAELYCSFDGKHYDNFDKINHPLFGGTYNCIALNAFSRGDVEVTKYFDANHNGVWDDGEKTLSDWTINLDDDSKETGKDGKVLFENLRLGSHSLSESLKDNWEQTGISCGEDEYDEGYKQEPDGQLIDNNYYVYVKPNETTFCEIGNYTDPVLTLQKSNNKLDVDTSPGSDVVYTLTVTATQSGVLDVTVTDLLPEGFEYKSGSWTADSDVRGDLRTGGTTTEPTYSSPGTWQLGDMVDGEKVILTFVATVNGEQTSGLYRDNAWARGNSLALNQVFANEDNGVFVGTDVNIVSSSVQGASYNVEGKKEILGAATALPSTGGKVFWTYLSLIMLILGSSSVIIGYYIKRRYHA